MSQKKKDSDPIFHALDTPGWRVIGYLFATLAGSFMTRQNPSPAGPRLWSRSAQTRFCSGQIHIRVQFRVMP